MPNRILKESICTSDNIDKLTAFQETVFYRLIVTCDDYGRADARPKLLASKLFPLKDIRPAQIEDALRGLTSAELVITYTVGGKPFLQMKTWDRHQQVRNKVSKFPSPDEADEICNQLQANDINCNQLQANVPVIQSNPIQSVSESNPRESTRARAFAPPSVEEVAAYVTEKGYGIDPEAFVAYYTAKGWKVGSSPMKDWKAAVVTWVKRDRESGRQSAVPAGVSKKVAQTNAQCQKHNTISPGMAEAARKMLEEDV